jgi:2-C-methyl-D-erythritol 4-phosphate cytidylyltransferase
VHTCAFSGYPVNLARGFRQAIKVTVDLDIESESIKLKKRKI